jgi:hypothetical protein
VQQVQFEVVVERVAFGMGNSMNLRRSAIGKLHGGSPPAPTCLLVKGTVYMYMQSYVTGCPASPLQPEPARQLQVPRPFADIRHSNTRCFKHLLWI